MLFASLLSLGLLALAGLLLDAHRRAWKAADAARDQADPGESRFAQGRYRRRTLASATIALVGALIALWPITPREPAWVLVYTGVLTLLATQIFSLGVWDAWASGRYYRGVARRRVAEHAESLREVVDAARSLETERPGA